jgi:hypothetical protein
MKDIKSIIELKSAIQQLENIRAVKGLTLTDEFSAITGALRPANILKSKIGAIFSQPALRTPIVNAVLVLAANFVFSKVFPRKRMGPFVRFVAGTIIGIATTSVAFRKTIGIKSEEVR